MFHTQPGLEQNWGGKGGKKSPFRVPNVSPMSSFLLSVKLVILEGSSVWHRGVAPHSLWCMCQFSQGPPLPLHSSPVGQDLQPGSAPSLASGWQRVTGDGQKMDRAERGEDTDGTEGKKNTIWLPQHQSGAIWWNIPCKLEHLKLWVSIQMVLFVKASWIIFKTCEILFVCLFVCFICWHHM